MFGIGGIIVLNLYTHFQVYKDDTYLLDEEKPKIGAFISLQRLHANKNFYIGVTVVYFLLKLGYIWTFLGSGVNTNANELRRQLNKEATKIKYKIGEKSFRRKGKMRFADLVLFMMNMVNKTMQRELNDYIKNVKKEPIKYGKSAMSKAKNKP